MFFSFLFLRELKLFYLMSEFCKLHLWKSYKNKPELYFFVVPLIWIADYFEI